MKNIARGLFGLLLTYATMHFGLVGCQNNHLLIDDDRVRDATTVAIPALLLNTDTFHDKDVQVTGTVATVGDFAYALLLVQQFTLRADNGAVITVFVPEGESIPRVGRNLTVFGRFEQCPNLSRVGLPCVIYEYYRDYDETPTNTPSSPSSLSLNHHPDQS